MKKFLLVILTIFAIGTSSAQQDNYLIADLKTVGATNLMASDCISYTMGCKAIGVSGGVEWTEFITETLATRLRCDLCYVPSSIDDFNTLMTQFGAGLIVSNRDGFPYGFFEIRPRFDRTRIGPNYSHVGTRAFITTSIGIGYNCKLKGPVWLMIECGATVNTTYYNSYATNNRDEVGGFLTLGVGYLINH